jgi:nitrite reductase/ring-hydroxylating ferredoxin subunit
MIEVCGVEEINQGENKIFKVKGVEIGIFNIEGEFYALLNSCCHQRGPVCTGDIKEKIGGDIPQNGKLPDEYYTGEYVVICPWHGWSYDIKTGGHAGDPDIKIQTYKTIIEDQIVYLDL